MTIDYQPLVNAAAVGIVAGVASRAAAGPGTSRRRKAVKRKPVKRRVTKKRTTTKRKVTKKKAARRN